MHGSWRLAGTALFLLGLSAVPFWLGAPLHSAYTPRPAPFDRPLSRLESMLEQPMTFACHEQPLSDVLQELENQMKVRLWLDVQALDCEGIDPHQTSVTLDVTRMRFEAVLSLLLKPHSLTYLLREKDDLLIITTVVQAELELETRVYHVSDLVSAAEPLDRFEVTDCGEFLEPITESIDPDSWDHVGGRGSIRALPSLHALSVRQTQANHRRLEQWFAELRRGVRPPRHQAYAARPDPHELTVEVYPLPGTAPVETAEDEETSPAAAEGTQENQVPKALPKLDEEGLAKILMELISPETWETRGGPGSLRIRPATLVIKQRPAVHAELRRVWEDLYPGMLPAGPGDAKVGLTGGCYSGVWTGGGKNRSLQGMSANGGFF